MTRFEVTVRLSKGELNPLIIIIRCSSCSSFLRVFSCGKLIQTYT